MVQIKAPDLGSVGHIVDAVLDCKAHGVVAHIGGSCTETERSAQVTVQLALGADADQLLAKPGMGVDEGLSIVRNEMARTLALAARPLPDEAGMSPRGRAEHPGHAVLRSVLPRRAAELAPARVRRLAWRRRCAGRQCATRVKPIALQLAGEPDPLDRLARRRITLPE